MKFSIASAALLAASSFTEGVFANKHEQFHHNLEKRSYEPVRGIAGNACARREVRDLARNNWDQWTLFLLALQRFMSTDQSQKYSYYQIAGIHGQPTTPWGDAPRKRQNMNDCPHGSPIFMPWHAPYLALFEKYLDDHMTAVIAQYPANVRARWEAAHNCFRMPYWDSARRDGNEETAPILLWADTVTLETPSGRQTIQNPLSTYNFQSTQDFPSNTNNGAWRSMTKTYRRVQNPGAGASSNTNEYRQLLNQEQPTIRDRIANVFRDIKLFRLFSTEVYGQGTLNPESHDSGENIHNSVHNIVGGPTGGHMWYLEYAAFDPIFWLHHVNIDRWNSIWRKINPDSYMTSSNALSSTSFITQGDTLDWNTQLQPFPRDSAGTPWTPNDVRWTESSFSYFYPETAPGSTADSARQQILRLYGPGNGNRAVRKRSLRPLHARSNEQFEGWAPSVGDYDFSSVLTCNKFAFQGSYAVHFFLDNDVKNGSLPINGTLPNNGTYHSPIGNNATGGYDSNPYDGAYGSIPNLPVPVYDSSDPATVPFAPGYVGTHAIFSSTDEIDRDLMTSANIPLLTALQKHYDAGLLSDFSEATCTAYLKEHLKWRVVKSGNEEVPADHVPNLNIAVVGREVLSPQTDTDFATYSEAKVIPEITIDKPAGHNGAEQIIIAQPSDVPEYAGQCPVAEPEVEYEYVDEQGAHLYSSMAAPSGY